MHSFFSYPSSFPQGSPLSRWSAVLCCLLAFWASVDSPAMLIVPGSVCSTSSGPCPVQQADDDVIVDRAGLSASDRILLRHVHPFTAGLNRPCVAFLPRHR